MLESRIRKDLRDRDERGLRRTPHPPRGIDLSSNDYLGLAAHAEVMAAMTAAVEREGCGSGGSRLLRGHRGVFDEVERAFAVFKRADRSLYFSSGYLANLAVLSTLAWRGDRILADRFNHASLRDGARLAPATVVSFAHNDVDALRRLLDEPCPGQTFVVTESLFSMDGDTPPLADYADLCRRAEATLIVDEAHAVGLYGAAGSGLLEASGVDANEVVSINTAGKALGVSGAFVAGPEWLVDYLIQRARPFVFSTAPPPAVAAALLASLRLVGAEPWRRERVTKLTARFRQALTAAGVTAGGSGPIVPIVIGDTGRSLAVAADLQDRGFDVRAIRPPTVPPGTARLRVSINTSLSEAIVDRAAAAVADAMARVRTAGATSWHAASS